LSEEEKIKEENIPTTANKKDVKSDEVNTFQWYSLRVISGKEKATKENILLEVEEADIKSDVGEVFLPYEKVIEVRNNKKRIKEKMFLLFVIFVEVRSII